MPAVSCRHVAFQMHAVARRGGDAAGIDGARGPGFLCAVARRGGMVVVVPVDVWRGEHLSFAGGGCAALMGAVIWACAPARVLVFLSISFYTFSRFLVVCGVRFVHVYVVRAAV